MRPYPTNSPAPRSTWIHATQHSPLAKDGIRNVAVFDDERVGFLTIYHTDGTRFSPIRDIATKSSGTTRDVLSAWASDAPFLDLRNDKTQPLPTATPQPS